MTDPMQPTTILTDAVDSLLDQLKRHEEAATEIRATLAGLRKKMAGGGKRAGTKARSGKRRHKTIPAEQPTAEAIQ